MRPARGLLLVQPVTTEEVVNGIVLLDETRQRWVGQQCEVLAVGAPELCEDEDCERPHAYGAGDSLPMHPHDLAVGDWLVVRPRCFVATDEEKVWVCKQTDVLAKLVLERRKND